MSLSEVTTDRGYFDRCVLLATTCSKWEECFVVCASSTRTRLLSHQSASVTSHVEKLPDVVPDQSRLIDEENTEVGAVCICSFSCFTQTLTVAPMSIIIQFIYLSPSSIFGTI